MIGIENPNTKVVKAVYCHWDGYLEHNGFILNEFYTASPKVNNLVALGDLSSLGADIGEKHAFDERIDADTYAETRCTFYTRDRGETAPYKRFETAAEAVEYYNGSWCEYFYLYRYDEDLQTGKWYYKDREGGAWKRLSTAMKKLQSKEQV
jgi:hypothetical protein